MQRRINLSPDMTTKFNRANVRRPLIRASIAILALAAASAANSQTTWTGGFDNDWESGLNWSPGFVPDATTNVIVSSAMHPATVTAGEFAQTLNLTLTDGQLYNESNLAVYGDFTMSGTLSPSYLSSSGLGSIANIGTSASTISISALYGGYSTVETSGFGTLNFNSNTFTSDVSSQFYTQTQSTMTFAAATSVNFASYMNNAGTAEFAGPSVNINSGAYLYSGGGLFGFNDTSSTSLGSTINNGQIYSNDSLLYAGGSFTTNWWMHGDSDTLNFGYNEQNQALSAATLTNNYSTIQYTNTTINVNGDVFINGGYLGLGTYAQNIAQNGGALNITGDLNVTSGGYVTLENGNNTLIEGDLKVGGSGTQQGVEIWGSTTVDVIGDIDLSKGGRVFVQDLDVVAPYVEDFGGGILIGKNIVNNDGWLEIGTSSSVTAETASFWAPTTPTDPYQLHLGTGGSLEVTTGDLTFSGSSSGVNGGTVVVDNGNLKVNDVAQFTNNGLLNVKNGGLSVVNYFSNWYGTTNVNSVDNYANGSWTAGFVNYGPTAQLNVAGNFTNRNYGEFTTMNSATTTITNGSLLNENSAYLQVHDNGSAVTVNNGGYTNQDYATTNIWFYGKLNVNGGDYNNFGQSASTQVGSSGAVTLNGGNFYNHGGSVQVGSAFDQSGSITINPVVNGAGMPIGGGTYNQDGATATTSVYGTIIAGAVNIHDGSVYIGDLSTAAGEIQATTYTQDGANTQTKVYGTLQASNINVNGGTMGGAGTFIGNVNVNAGGTFNVGDPQTSHIVGNFDLNPGGTLILNLTSGGNDMLDVSGLLQLGGTLDIVVGPGYTPTGTYNLFQYAGVTGSFNTIEETINGNIVPLSGSLNFESNSGSLNATPEPSSLAVLALGGFGFLGLRRRKRQ